MGENRITYYGWTDYSIASLHLIIEDLNEDYLPSTLNATKRLKELREETIHNSARLDDASSMIDYIDFYITLFESFKYDLKRILDEMPRGIEKKHIDILSQIFERSCHEERQSKREFKKEYIEKVLKDESLRPFLDEIYEVTGNLLVNNKNLGSLSKRLATFIGSVAPSEKKLKIKTLVSFPTPKGIIWDNIEIRFLSYKAVQIIAGNASEGREYQEIGFLDNRGKGPNFLWLVLASFAKENGEISWDSKGLHKRVHDNLKSHVNRLGKTLMELFGIRNEKPFKYRRKTKSYVAKFKVGIIDEDAYDELLTSFR